jgi:small-conductance mechanosensitive channel
MRARLCLLFMLVIASIAEMNFAVAQAAAQDDDLAFVAPVVIDGQALFRVRGFSALPAHRRSEQIRERILQLARDPSIDPAGAQLLPGNDTLILRLGDLNVVELHPVDAELEAVPLDVLAAEIQKRVAAAILDFRELRTPERLLRNTGILLAITLVAALLLWSLVALSRWLDRVVEQRVKRHIEQLEHVSHRMISASQLWAWLGSLLRTVRVILVFALLLFWLQIALGLYPWTRSLATQLFTLILDPLKQIGNGLIETLPDLFFLLVLTFVVRFILRATRTFFDRVHRGRIKLQRFDQDLAIPTYRIIRVLIIVFALVVAYPYIPGSDSEAFKGLSIFFGVILSIGSSSFIANILAGYSLIYRRAFRTGDRVRIGDLEGEVLEMRTLNTRLKSVKNEEINLPNSIVLGSAIVNYSMFQSDQGLILHTNVGIGYDVSWRQVEAMLVEAASRTEGLIQEPPPFVLQKSLDDFTVLYQLNAYCDNASQMNRFYSDLHANIQDVFNEQGVQIMSPHYVADTPEPKVVPPEKW